MNNSNSHVELPKEGHEIWGAEAHLYREKWFGYNAIKKVRIPKKYRIEQIDSNLRTTRTSSESKLMIAAKNSGVQTPFVFEIDLTETSITMEFIEGRLVKEILNEDIPFDEKTKIVEIIGQKVGLLHSNDIIHGALRSLSDLCQ